MKRKAASKGVKIRDAIRKVAPVERFDAQHVAAGSNPVTCRLG